MTITPEATHPQPQPQGPPPHAQILQLMMGMWHSQIIAAAARFGVADLIASGVHDVDTLAAECGANANALYRLLRACAALGVVAETEPRRFALTPAGECLCANRPGSLRDIVIAETAPGHWLPWGRLFDAVQRGESVARDTLGMDPWEYYAQNREEGASFARGMGNLSALAAQDVTRVYDARSAQRVVDVGGSQGVLLAGILSQNASARGVLFDRPEVIEEAKQVVTDPRIELAGGDFFQSVPEGGDLYLLKHILHDWPDDACTAILRNIRRAMNPGAKLLVVEFVLPEAPQPSPVSFMDLNMLVMLNGRERTAAEFAQLLASAELRVTRVIPTGGMFSVIEAE